MIETHSYKTVGNLPIRLDVHGAGADAPKPALVWIHGGALIMGNRTQIAREQFKLYLDAGYVVIAIDYRLAPETKLSEIIEDLKDAFGWIRAEGSMRHGIDPHRIAAVGHSAGGYLTLMSGFRVEPRPRALVSFYGYGDIIGEWYSRPDPFYSQQKRVPKEEAYRAVGGPALAEDPGKNDRSKFYLYCRQNGLWPKEVAGRDPDAEPAYFLPFCPVKNVTKDYPPTILLHGDSDTDVPYEQSVMMAAELERKGVRHELITIPHGPHGFERAQGGLQNPTTKQAFDRVLAFLANV